jgi:hypothetical protein
MSRQRAHLVTATTLLALACAWAQPVAAAEPPIETHHTVSASVGPLGLSFGLLELAGPGDWSARVLLHTGSLTTAKSNNRDLDGIRYDVRQRFGPGLSLLGDYRPWHDTGWRLTGGLVGSRLTSTLSGRPDGAGSYAINGRVYNVAQVGVLSGTVRHKPVDLYVGGGWESKTPGAAGWRFVSDLGVLVAAKPSVTLSGSAAAGNTALQQDLQAQQDKLRKFGVGLVGSVGVAYVF